MNTNYPQILFEVQQFLVESALNLKGGSNEDGRVASIEKEDDVINALLSRYDCIKGKKRHWFDIAIKDITGEWIYCNIKISNGKTDNALQKKGIVHSLTNLHESRIPGSMNMNTMHRLLVSNMLDNRNYYREYYYIYLDKNENVVIIRSLCDIEYMQSNPSNILQINWCKEKQRLELNPSEDIVEIKNKVCKVIVTSIIKYIDTCSELLNAYK
jgi:hypothetical protein